MTPLDHPNATAMVSITGLALGCYNKATQNYEVGLIRQNTHTLTIEVKKQLPNGLSRMIYQIADAQHRIFIDAENAATPADPIYTVGEAFDRNDGEHDPEDFRWVIDFEKDLNGGAEVNLKAPSVPVTEMYVSKPRLYADPDLMAPDPYLLVQIDRETNDPVPNQEPEMFGFFTEGIKADITCQDGGAVILRVEGPQGFHVHLPHGTARPHEIIIQNTCPPKEEENQGGEGGGANTTNPDDMEPTDFREFYAVVVDTNGKMFDLKSTVRPERGEGAVCNGSSLGTRDSLFPLPT
jgi:hypothetical protein